MRHPAQIAAVVVGLAVTMSGAAVVQGADTLRLGLADALARARERHPAVAQAAAERRARDADVLASAAAFTPRIDIQLGFLRSDDLPGARLLTAAAVVIGGAVMWITRLERTPHSRRITQGEREDDGPD